MKFSVFLALLLLAIIPAQADRYLFDAKVGYFRPFSDELRNIYSEGWASYQVEAAYSPFSSCNSAWWSNFFAWGGYNYLYDKGETRSGMDDDETIIQFYNFTLGLKYLVPMFCNTRLYGAAGARYFFLRIDNCDDAVGHRERANGMGSAFSLGVLFQPYRCFVMDFFTDVMVRKFTDSDFTTRCDEVAEDLDISGITFGIGIGILF
ncbi:MAG: hypothetical protein S4CHLAM2_13810 [Chlamydiales bacterium]|nr:hypothetical protein [Chlamydiales bacterium]